MIIGKISILIFTLLFIESFQQTVNTKTVPQTPLNKTEVPFQKFNDILLRNLDEPSEADKKYAEECEEKLGYQIYLWTSIGLAFVLYFIVMALVDMPNPKSSILYAKYDTTRSEHEL